MAPARHRLCRRLCPRLIANVPESALLTGNPAHLLNHDRTQWLLGRDAGDDLHGLLHPPAIGRLGVEAHYGILALHGRRDVLLERVLVLRFGLRELPDLVEGSFEFTSFI